MDKQLVFDLALGRISDQEFLKRIGVGTGCGSHVSLDILNDALARMDADGVELGLILGFVFGFTAGHFEVLCALATKPWHVKHEDVVTALGSLRDGRAIRVLADVARLRPPYLEFDDSRALLVKAVRAIGQFVGPDADGALAELSTDGDPSIREAAALELARRIDR